MTPHARALLDTSVVIDFPGDEVAKHAATLAISAITLAELAYGMYTGDPLLDAEREARYHRLANTFEVLDFDSAAGRVYGVLVEKVRRYGRDPRPRRFDLLLAAVAVSHRLPLLTRNGKDFVGLAPDLTVVEL